MADDLILDLTNYKDTVGNYVPPGRYPVVVEDAELGESAQKKTPQLTIWLRVVGGDHDGSTLVENLYLTEGSKFRVVGFLQALGIKTPRKKLSFKLQQFIGRRLYALVEDDTYNGRTRSRVSAFERFSAPKGDDAGDLSGLEEFAAASAPSEPDEPEEKSEPAAPAKAAKAAPVEPEPEPEPDPEDEEDDSDAEAIDLDELDL